MKRRVFLKITGFLLLTCFLANAENRNSGLVVPMSVINIKSKVVESEISFVTEYYTPGTTTDLVFYYTYSSPDNEWDDGVSLNFPEGVYVNSATVCTTTGYQQLPYNGETGDGAIVTWGNITGGSGLGGLKSSGQFSVNVTISEDFSGPMLVDWYIAGDAYGAAPNFNSGTISITKALDYDLAIIDFNPKFVLLGTSFDPVVAIKNVGIQETTSFIVNLQVPEFDYNHSVSVTTPIVSNEVVQVVFPSYTPLVAATYVVTPAISEGGGENQTNDEFVINGLVSPLAEAYAINGMSLTYNELNLLNGQTVNVGNVEGYPWQMAEEYDGNYIYRVNHDASIGTVDPDGTFHLLGIMTGVPGYPSGLAYNWDTGVMYVVVQNEVTDHSHFCTLNIETLELTEVAVNTSLILGMDFANDGCIYAVSYQNELIKFDPVTAEFIVVGPIGIDILYPQDVSFDVETGLLYTIASGNYFSVFGTYDLNTGAFQLVTDMMGVFYYTLVITKNPNHYFPVTFNVDMSSTPNFSIENDKVYISGTFNEWTEPGNHQKYALTKADESMIYSATYNLKPGSYDYKYYLNSGWSGAEWSDDYPHRVFEITDSEIVLNDVWGNVQTSTPIKEFLINVYPNPASKSVSIISEVEIVNVRLIDMLGRIVHWQEVKSNSTQINLDKVKAGLHILIINSKDGVITKKVQVVK